MPTSGDDSGLIGGIPQRVDPDPPLEPAPPPPELPPAPPTPPAPIAAPPPSSSSALSSYPDFPDPATWQGSYVNAFDVQTYIELGYSASEVLAWQRAVNASLDARGVPGPSSSASPPAGGGGAPGGAGGPVGEIDDEAASAAIANANHPDNSDLRELQISNPFDDTSVLQANPPLKGAGALSAFAQACDDFDIDLLACMANVLNEGAGGGMGDGGHAYGPTQNHLTDFAERPFYGKGAYNDAVNAWAWSENGIRYQVRGMAVGSPSARRLHGHAAVYAIVYGYERPGDRSGAYRTRAATYDQLARMGSSWAGYVADRLAGPSGGGAVSSSPSSGGADTTYRPAGVVATWRELVDVFKLTVPAKSDQVDSLASSLKEIFG